jgi:hypothetical protein
MTKLEELKAAHAAYEAAYEAADAADEVDAWAADEVDAWAAAHAAYKAAFADTGDYDAAVEAAWDAWGEYKAELKKSKETSNN